VTVRVRIKRCRACGGRLNPEPLLRFENMPGAAQFLPDAAALATNKGEDLEVCQCAGCGLVQLNGPPVRYYREVVRAAAFSEEMRAFRTTQFETFARRHGLKGRKVLEVGCGRGEYLSILAGQGMEAEGLEHSAESVRHCAESGLTAHRGFMESDAVRLPNAPYDAFFLLSFLEHLPDPAAVLRGIAANLSDGAVGLVEVPDFDMIVEQGLFSEFIGDHLFYFTRETLSQLLAVGGFEVLECQAVWHDYILSATVRKRARKDLSHLLTHRDKVCGELHRFIDRCAPGPVAIWGASHQALAIVNLADLGGRVRYVVDSAPFKQGRYTPGSHLPILAPDTLKADPVGAVIVMAASYSDEVARIVRDRYDPSMKVAILRPFGLEEA